jgi:bifunctional ADP-heptose synthase (sugar kinase/adenylyltransferase)
MLVGHSPAAARRERDRCRSEDRSPDRHHVKLRVIGRHAQQLLRIDFETAPSHEVLDASSPSTNAGSPTADNRHPVRYGKGG